jgi:hypothetical protein
LSSTGSQRPEDLYADLLRTIEALGASWALAGAWATFRYRAEDRITTDADFLVSWVSGLEEAVRDLGWETKAARDPGEPPHLIRARRGEERVDLLIALTDYQQEALRRAEGNVLSLEDVLVHKIIAWRLRDRDDIDEMLRLEHDIDWDYVRTWVEHFGFEERLEGIEPR